MSKSLTNIGNPRKIFTNMIVSSTLRYLSEILGHHTAQTGQYVVTQKLL